MQRVTSSGTYDYNLSNGSMVLTAYGRCQLRLPSLRNEHFFTARNELNLALVKFSNKQPNLWKVELITQTLTQGTATYTVPARVVMLLDAYVSLNYGTSSQTDRLITPFSRTEYASVAAKATQGFPNSYWFNRQITPTITFWPVPDGNGPYTLNYYACSQMQDAGIPGGETPDLPYRWLDALTAELAYRVSVHYADPQTQANRKIDATEAWQEAAAQDTEGTSVSLAPSLAGYYR